MRINIIVPNTSNYPQQHKHIRKLHRKVKPKISLLLSNIKQPWLRFHQTCVNYDKNHEIFLLMIETFLRKGIVLSPCAEFLCCFQTDILTEFSQSFGRNLGQGAACIS